MKRIPKKLIGLLVLIAAVVIGWNLIFPSGTWRYKVTVSIETPEGIKTGSAVREIHVVHVPRTLPEVGSSVDIKGEAVVVDLGKRGVVYAVMGTDDQYTLFNAFPVEGATTGEGIRYYKSLKPGTRTSLKWTDRPLLVTFQNPADPKTVEAVYRISSKIMYPKDDTDLVIEDTLEKTFGKGVRLKDITVEMTDEKVTERIEKWLSWVAGYPEEPLYQIRQDDFSIEAQLRKANFIRR